MFELFCQHPEIGQTKKEETNSNLKILRHANSNKIWGKNKSFKPEHLQKSEIIKTGTEKQYGYASIPLKNGQKQRSENTSPKFNKKTKDKHSEQSLVDYVDGYLSSNKSMIDITEPLYIFTYNSPCLSRNDGVLSCMSLLLCKSIEWKEKYCH